NAAPSRFSQRPVRGARGFQRAAFGRNSPRVRGTMIILLDTAEFLWFVTGNPKLSARTEQEIRNPANAVYLSVASLWEIIVKVSIGKLPLPQSPEIYVPEQRQLHGIESLDLEEGAVKRLAKLPMLHRDPFDRMLLCQAQEYGLHFASSDPLIRQYQVTLL